MDPGPGCFRARNSRDALLCAVVAISFITRILSMGVKFSVVWPTLLPCNYPRTAHTHVRDQNLEVAPIARVQQPPFRRLQFALGLGVNGYQRQARLLNLAAV
jgi:hypothetical protein